MRSALAAAVVSLLLVVGRGEAQLLRVVGDANDPAAVRLREIVDRGGYRVLDRDTLLDGASQIAGDVVVVGADVRLEGRIAGSVAVLPGGELFLRPGAGVGGSAISLGGGLFVSSGATVAERLELPATVGTRVERVGDAYTLTLTPPPGLPPFEPQGIFGLQLPTYDRVNGATLRAGGLLRLGADSTAPVLRASVLYHVARDRPGAELQARLPIGRQHYALAEGARTTRSPDRWIRDDLTNSAAALLVGSDVRNYHEVDVVAVEIGRLAPPTLEAGESFAAARLRLHAARSRSLPARDVWSLFPPDDGWRPNPAIEEGGIISALPGLAFGWRGRNSGVVGDLEVEAGTTDFGRDGFGLVTGDARWDATALWTHTVSVRARVRYVLGGAPRQRWSLLGGPGTLPTLETGKMWGDRLLFLESLYSVPVPEIILPIVGSPVLVLRHALGSAWTARRPPLEQNLGLAVAFPLVRASLDLDPTDPGRVVFSASASLPF